MITAFVLCAMVCGVSWLTIHYLMTIRDKDAHDVGGCLAVLVFLPTLAATLVLGTFLLVRWVNA